MHGCRSFRADNYQTEIPTLKVVDHKPKDIHQTIEAPLAKVSAEQSNANRNALIEAASRLFKQRGVASVGVADVCAAAGLTHGALYSHFGSKEALLTEAFERSRNEAHQRMVKALGETPSADAVVDYYVSLAHRDSVNLCCPMVAISGEAERQSRNFRAKYMGAFKDLVAILDAGSSLDPSVEAANLSLVIAASIVGVVSVARALKSSDPELSDQLVASSRLLFDKLVTPGRKRTRQAKTRALSQQCVSSRKKRKVS